MTAGHRDDPDVVRSLSASYLLRPVDAAIRAVWRGAAVSRTAGVYQRARARWGLLTPAGRHARIGIILVVAAVTHVGWQWWQEPPPGWLWLMVPGLAAAAGAMLWWSSNGEAETP